MSLVSATDRLCEFPESGGIIPRFERSGVREIIVRPYRIAYRLVGDEIRVQKVHHGARLAFIGLSGMSMSDPEPILNAARRAGAQQAEVFAVETEETPVRFEANGVE